MGRMRPGHDRLTSAVRSSTSQHLLRPRTIERQRYAASFGTQVRLGVSLSHLQRGRRIPLLAVRTIAGRIECRLARPRVERRQLGRNVVDHSLLGSSIKIDHLVGGRIGWRSRFTTDDQLGRETQSPQGGVANIVTEMHFQDFTFKDRVEAYETHLVIVAGLSESGVSACHGCGRGTTIQRLIYGG